MQQAADQKHKPSSTTRSPSSSAPQAVDTGSRGRRRGVHGQRATAHRRACELTQPPARAAPARQLHHAAPRARMARHPRAAAHRGRRARLAAQRARRPTYEQMHLRCSPACSATSAARATTRSGTSARAASSSGAIPGAHLAKKPGRWIVAAELVETTRLYGRGIAAIEPHWLPRHRRPPAEEAAARAALGEEGRPRSSRSSGRRCTASSSTATGG